MVFNANRKQKGVIAAIVTVMLLLVCLISTALVGVAHADNPPSSGGEEDSEGLSGLHYFTDYDDGFTPLCVYLYNNNIVDPIYSHHWYHEEFEERFREEYLNHTYDDIRESYVIFEMRYGFKLDKMSSDNFVFVLDDFFRELKNRDCKIMFIGGTDEYLFNNNVTYTHFLEYVDIHVNADRMSVFLANALNSEAEKFPQKMLQNSTIILDSNFAPVNDPHAQNGAWDGWFIKYRLVPYLESKYNVSFADFDDCIDYLDSLNIKILCHTGGSDFYSLTEGVTVSCGEFDIFYLSYLGDRNVFALSGAWGDQDYVVDWLNTILAMRDNAVQHRYPDGNVPADYFTIYFYNMNGVGEDYIKASGIVNKDKLRRIIVDFLTDGDLSQYHNYDGRCIVSHKLIDFSDGGWMLYDEYLMSEFSNCWDSYLNDDELIMLFSMYPDFEIEL